MLLGVVIVRTQKRCWSTGPFRHCDRAKHAELARGYNMKFIAFAIARLSVFAKVDTVVPNGVGQTGRGWGEQQGQ